jgi:undecaprenyl-diphosphatase
MAAVPEQAVGRLHHLQSLEHGLVCRMAEEVGNRSVLFIFRAASRLGDWPLSVFVGFLLWSIHGSRIVLLWTAVSVAAVGLQTALKRLCSRLRPCERPDGPPQRAPIPDKGSFPSGHTLHAVMAAMAMVHFIPVLALPFVVVALVVGCSRVVLGVHYPSDVAAGASMGLLFGSILTAIA